MAEKISEYTDVTIGNNNFRIYSEWRVGYQGGADQIVTAVAVNGKLSTHGAEPLDTKLQRLQAFPEPEKSELTAILLQQQASILAQVEAQQSVEPYPDPEEAATDETSTGDNQANDDSNVSTTEGEPAGNAAQEAEASKNEGTETTNNPNLSGGGNAQSNVATEATDAPGRRLKNPLGSLSSYNYQLTLYMITPDAYDAFVASGRKNINALTEAGAGGGAYIVAQSAGINNNESQRSPGFELDYYIDNVRLKQALGGESSQSSTNTYDISFTIIEPYGFSFITNLRKTSDAFIQYANDSGYSKGGMTNPSKQFFVLGIRFLGYDVEGNIVTGEQEFEGQPLDPNGSNGNFLFETYYDILLTGIKFKIEGGATTYSITAAATSPGESFGTKRGRLVANRTITASTFEEALTGENGLFTQMNQYQANLLDQGAIEVANEYRVEFIGPDVDALRTAQLITPEDVDKGKWPSQDIENTEESTDAESATATPDNTKRQITFSQGTSLLEVFDELVKGSTYLRDALKVVYENNPTPDTSRTQPQNDPASNKKIAWYHVTSQLSNAKWDPTVSDWAYVTTFRFETYQTPVITSATVNPGMDYYGPHKRYEYWYTGENREILEYTQQLDNLYYNEVLAETPNEDGVGTGGTANTPMVPGQKTPEPSLNSLGGGREAQNNYVTSLYSPDAYATAKIKILGDPDFLVQESRGDINTVYQRFYGDNGFRVNANGGQVFIEIDFKEAVDYNTETGVLDINDSILFFEYPENVSDKIKGVSYKIIDLVSTFSDGMFTQEISAAINTFPNPDSESSADENRQDTSNATPNSTGTGSTNNTGMRPDPGTGSTNQNQGGQAAGTQGEAQIQETQPDANDDAGGA